MKNMTGHRGSLRVSIRLRTSSYQGWEGERKSAQSRIDASQARKEAVGFTRAGERSIGPLYLDSTPLRPPGCSSKEDADWKRRDGLDLGGGCARCFARYRGTRAGVAAFPAAGGSGPRRIWGAARERGDGKREGNGRILGRWMLSTDP